MTIYLNTRRLDEDEPDVILRKMSTYIIHPDYVPGDEVSHIEANIISAKLIINFTL